MVKDGRDVMDILAMTAVCLVSAIVGLQEATTATIWARYALVLPYLG